jgi:hypothetical protein
MAKAESRDLHQRLEALNARVKEASLRGAWQKEPKEKKEDVQPWRTYDRLRFLFPI